MNWTYIERVRVVFGEVALTAACREIGALGGRRGLLVTSPSFVARGVAREFVDASEGRIAAVFSDIHPNPDVADVDAAADLAREMKADFIVALGGGSVLDAAKVIAVLALNSDSALDYLLGAKPVPEEHLPLIAVPTTSGTGSEVTSVAVLSDHAQGIKAPLLSETFFASVAIVDPRLTMSVSPRTTAVTGFDALCHAIEAYWNRNHQPVCDVLATHAIGLILHNLERAVTHGADYAAREAMAEASVVAGMAFCIPKTTSSHACSYPLTNRLGIDHGEACALTIDYFMRLNVSRGVARIEALARKLGFASAYALADEIARLRAAVGLRSGLADLNLSDASLEQLAAESQHPNLRNNPVDISLDDLRRMYAELAKR